MNHDAQRRASSHKPGFNSGQALVHWEYSPEEWALFDRVDWWAIWLRSWLLTLAPLVVVIVLAIVFTLVNIFSHVNLFGFMLPATTFGIVIASISYGLSAYSYVEAKARHKARKNQDQPQRVTFSKDGVWMAGIHFALHDLFKLLVDVHITSQPTVLHFHQKEMIFNNYRHVTIHVLVPHGHEGEATQLMERFRADIDKRKRQKLNTIPEPI